jgi:hypothetical protein
LLRLPLPRSRRWQLVAAPPPPPVGPPNARLTIRGLMSSIRCVQSTTIEARATLPHEKGLMRRNVMPPAKDIDQVSAITFMRSIVDIARMGRFLRLGWTWPGMRDRSSWRPSNLTFSTQFGRNPPTNVRAACQTAASEWSLARHTGTRIHNARPFRPCGRGACAGVVRLPHCQCSVKTEYNQTNQPLDSASC